jgi:hypothetical protein
MLKGTRVGAILKSDQQTVHLLGYGTYDGDEIPGPEAQGFGKAIREAQQTNPKITLDNGKTVWGCECWWGPEEKIKNSIGTRQIIETDIDEARKQG